MAQMSPQEILKRLEAKNEVVVINEVKIAIFGLSFPELAHIAPHVDRKNTEYALNYIVKATIGKAFPEWKEEEIDVFVKKADPKHLLTLVNKVKELSTPKGDAEKKDQAPEQSKKL